MKNIIIILTLLFYSCDKTVDIFDDITPTDKLTYLNSIKGRVSISKEAGSKIITVESNTEWIISADGNVTGFDIHPLKGEGNGSINLKWDRVKTEYYNESTTININYYSNGKRLCNTILLQRNRD